MHDAMCILLHLVMLQHVLTNADHVGLWKIFVCIGAFWLDVTRKWKEDQLKIMEAYCPVLTGPKAAGWIEIIYLSLIILLLPAIDLRHYRNDLVKPEELEERDTTQEMYRDWQKWFASEYVCKRDGIELDIETEVLSPALLHLAIVLVDYHKRQITLAPQATVFKTFTTTDLHHEIKAALERYDKRLIPKFNRELKKPNLARSSSFFLFEGSDLEFRRCGRSGTE
ncbi:hypothetical protein B0H10DRAFT_2214886 [Mycena sp. CBHHK59/15]|nr:hypothetical protein B0H10DRAFT_2214886 [Mycena sp. CBHHK59/15]